VISPAAAEFGAIDQAGIQRRSVRLLATGQILGGLGVGATVSLGALLAESVSGSAAFSGMAATMSTLGAAALAIPLAGLARRRGRRRALSTGALIAAVGAALTIVAASLESFPLLLLALALLGAGSAVGLQARFAATDLAADAHRARDLSLVVWATTIGAVTGPNLVGPGDAIGNALGMPALTGSFLFAITAQLAASALYLIALRPDPLLVRQKLDLAPRTVAAVVVMPRPAHARFAIATVGLSHATMVSVMAMTPVHLSGHGASISLIGFVISLHIAGMFALSPVFGILADRIGRVQVILVGQSLFAAALLVTALGAENDSLVTVGLVLLGLGWSASTVAGSALVTESTAIDRRPKQQGRTDLIMNIAGALGGALAGPTLALLGYAGLAYTVSALVLAVFVLAALLPSRRPPALDLSAPEGAETPAR
jgi:MFS family permease